MRGRREERSKKKKTERIGEKEKHLARTCCGPQRRRPGEIRFVLSHERSEPHSGGAHALGLAERGRSSEERAGVFFFAVIVVVVVIVASVVAATSAK